MLLFYLFLILIQGHFWSLQMLFCWLTATFQKKCSMGGCRQPSCRSLLIYTLTSQGLSLNRGHHRTGMTSECRLRTGTVHFMHLNLCGLFMIGADLFHVQAKVPGTDSWPESTPLGSGDSQSVEVSWQEGVYKVYHEDITLN